MGGIHRPVLQPLLLVFGLTLLVGLFLLAWRPKNTARPPSLLEDENVTITECPVLLWSDEFDGIELDTDEWEFQLGNGCDIGLCGWGNHELQSYEKENTIVSNGTLKLYALHNNNNSYTSSRIRTIGNVSSRLLHGIFEARIKLPFGQGLWPAFWMMPTDSVYGTWPKSGEIDIMENLGHEPFTVHGTVHYSNGKRYFHKGGKHLYQTQTVNNNDNGVEFFRDFHDFAIVKTPGRIQWLVDGSEYFVVDRTSVSMWPFEEYFYFILNVAVGGDWPGDPDSTTTFPQVMEVDHVRVYSSNAGKSFGHLVGPRFVQRNETGVVYSVVGGTIWNSFDWDVSNGITLVNQTGPSVVVDFGYEESSSAFIQVTGHSDACGTSKQFSMGITLVSLVVDLKFVDGTTDTSQEKAMFRSATGSYRRVPNPSMNSSVNPSPLVIEYTQ